MLYDITRTITPQTAVWPGDSTFQAQPVLQIGPDSVVNLYTLTLSAHTGSHADAYYHFSADGTDPATMPLEAYIGPARVVTVDKTGPIQPDDLAHVDLNGGQRLLIHSAVSDLPDDQWPESFPYLSVELIDHLADLDYRLIGLDSPSVDAFDSKTLACHHRLRARGLVNLESLCLRGVPDGDYELIALPLRLQGVCGSPVRALLRSL